MGHLSVTTRHMIIMFRILACVTLVALAAADHLPHHKPVVHKYPEVTYTYEPPKCTKEWEILPVVAKDTPTKTSTPQAFYYTYHVEYDVCSYNVCTYGEEPWYDEDGNIQFFPTWFMCPRGTIMNLEDLTYPCSVHSTECDADPRHPAPAPAPVPKH